MNQSADHVHDEEAEEVGDRESNEHLMRILNKKCPLEGIKEHEFYDETFVMYVVVG